MSMEKTIDTKHLESLLERVTPGEWRFKAHVSPSDWAGNIVGSYGVNSCGNEKTRTISCQTKYGTKDEVAANAELTSLAPTLARRVIAAEKLAHALAMAHDESLAEDSAGWLLNRIDDLLKEWDKSQ
jgi:hypothetical protein